MNGFLLFVLTLFGFFDNGPVYDLRRRSSWEDYVRGLNYWVITHEGIVALATVIILLFIFTIFCFWIVGVSATESGALYNNFDKVI